MQNPKSCAMSGCHINSSSSLGSANFPARFSRENQEYRDILELRKWLVAAAQKNE